MWNVDVQQYKDEALNPLVTNEDAVLDSRLCKMCTNEARLLPKFAESTIHLVIE